MTEPFWKTKTLQEMTRDEWESLCDRCGLCCLHKLEDEDTGDIHYTCISCRLLDPSTATCTKYERRHKEVPGCLVLTPKNVKTLDWLPPTCAYLKVAKGEDLAPWHPLVSGSFNSVHEAGISVRNRVVSETIVPEDKFEDFIADWIVPFEGTEEEDAEG